MKNVRNLIGESWKFILCVGVVALLFTFGNMAHTDSMRVAHIDIQQVFPLHPEVMDALQELEQQEAEMRMEIEGLQDEQEIMMHQQMMQARLQEIEQQLLGDAIDKLFEDIGKVSEEAGFDYVFDQNVIFHGGEDITGLVVEDFQDRFDVQEPGVQEPGLDELEVLED